MTTTSSAEVLLIADDLNAVARVDGACKRLGLVLSRSPVARGADALADFRGRLALIDLDAAAPEILGSAAEIPARVVGFFSHVDEGTGRRAAELGLTALPRGRFWRELPELISVAVRE